MTQDPGRTRHRLVATIIFLAALLVFPLAEGTSPPPGIFAPDDQSYSFGEVVLNNQAEISIYFTLNPTYDFLSPVTISEYEYGFHSNQENSFSVDPHGTTCVPGVTVTSTRGCSLTIRFIPTSLGPKRGEWFLLRVCTGTSSPTCPNGRLIASMPSFIGNGVAPAIPLLSLSALCLLVVLIIVTVPTRSLDGRRAR